MTTSILALPLYTFAMQVRTNEDWLDAWAYLDPASGDPISLAGLTVSLMVRPDPTSSQAVLTASTAATVPNGLPVQGSVVLSANVLGLSVPAAAIGRVAPGSYVFEVLAQGDGLNRVVAAGALTVLQGVVR